MTGRNPRLAQAITVVYASLVLLYSAYELQFGLLIFFADHHGTGFVGTVFIVPGFILFALGVALLLGARWASFLPAVVALFPSVVPFAWLRGPAHLRTPLATWMDIVGLAAPAVFLVLALLAFALRLKGKHLYDRNLSSGN